MSESNQGQIYALIGKAIGEIGAISKDKKNPQQGFMYRGIDQVYNALNPVMARLGLFLTPEIIDQKREERQTAKGGALIYTILTIRFTVYAPDGSNVSLSVIGEAMDSGDKASNKAMSVAMKYAMFQLFCIPTEEMIDPDGEVHEVAPKSAPKGQGTAAKQTAPQPAPKAAPEKAEAAIIDELNAIDNLADLVAYSTANKTAIGARMDLLKVRKGAILADLREKVKHANTIEELEALREATPGAHFKDAREIFDAAAAQLKDVEDVL